MPALDARLLAAGGLCAPRRAGGGYWVRPRANLPCTWRAQAAARRVVAADIRPAPLARARALVEKHRCGAAVECRLGDGLHVLSPDEADDIVIAGVSGVTAAEMLAAAPQFWRRASGSFLCRPPSAQSCAAGCGKMAFRFWMKHLCTPRAVFIQHCAQSTRGGCGSLRCWNAQLALPQSRRRLRPGYLRHVAKLVRKYTLGVPLAENAPFVQLAGQVDAMAERCEQEAQKWMLKK